MSTGRRYRATPAPPAAARQPDAEAAPRRSGCKPALPAAAAGHEHLTQQHIRDAGERMIQRRQTPSVAHDRA
ncbi:hypothetical protein [Dactylosporangium sp. CA-139066]|uniref:hypothetical protein n=1 Tax=Dactylosporangium sp. CA-139066 TaxID=3239930 RepID=UPI003D93BF1F